MYSKLIDIILLTLYTPKFIQIIIQYNYVYSIKLLDNIII